MSQVQSQGELSRLREMERALASALGDSQPAGEFPGQASPQAQHGFPASPPVRKRRRVNPEPTVVNPFASAAEGDEYEEAITPGAFAEVDLGFDEQELSGDLKTGLKSRALGVMTSPPVVGALLFLVLLTALAVTKPAGFVVVGEPDPVTGEVKKTTNWRNVLLASAIPSVVVVVLWYVIRWRRGVQKKRAARGAGGGTGGGARAD